MLETLLKFAPLLACIIAVTGLSFTAVGVMVAWHSHNVRTVSEFWRDFDKTSIQYPDLSVAASIGNFDFTKLTLDSSKEKFAQYVWYLSLLVFCIEQTLRLGRGRTQWNAFFLSQIGMHSRFFSSSYSDKVFLPTLSRRLGRMIKKTVLNVDMAGGKDC